MCCYVCNHQEVRLSRIQTELFKKNKNNKSTVKKINCVDPMFWSMRQKCEKTKRSAQVSLHGTPKSRTAHSVKTLGEKESKQGHAEQKQKITHQQND